MTDVVRPGLIEPVVKGSSAARKQPQPQPQLRVLERSGQPRRRASRSNSSNSGSDDDADYRSGSRRETRQQRRPSPEQHDDGSNEPRDRRGGSRSRSRSNETREGGRQYDTNHSDEDRDARRPISGGIRREERERERGGRRGAQQQQQQHDPFDRHDRRDRGRDRDHDRGRDHDRDYDRDDRQQQRGREYDEGDRQPRSRRGDDRQRERQGERASAIRSRIPSEQHLREAPVAQASAPSRPLERTGGKAAPQSPEQSSIVDSESSRLTPPIVAGMVAGDTRVAVAEGVETGKKEATAALKPTGIASTPAAAPTNNAPAPIPAHTTAAATEEAAAPRPSTAEEARPQHAMEQDARLTPPLHKGTALPRQQPSASDPLYFDSGDAEELKEFVSSAAPELAGTVRCEIRRDKKGMGKGSHPCYYLHLERPNPKDASKIDKVFLLAGRKRKKCKTSNYLISCDPADLSRDSESYLAKLRANFVGTHFTIFDNGANLNKKKKKLSEGEDYRKELGAIIYEKNVLGAKGPRKMSVVIPAMDQMQKAMEFKPLRESDTMQERIKLDRMDDLIGMENKKPDWSEKSQTYELKFGGRVTMASVKNFQIVHPKQPDYKVLQFGRVGEHSFTMDYQYPMSALQAFSICLSSLDGKWACE